MGPGGGMRSPDASGMIGEIEQRKRETVSSLDTQKESAVGQIRKSFETQVKEYKGRKDGILKTIADVKSKLSEIPNVPQAKDIRQKLSGQLEQMRQALDHINKALDYMRIHSEQQKQRLETQFELKKREVVTSFQAQKSQLLVRVASQKMMMQQQSQMALAHKSPEGGKVKG